MKHVALLDIKVGNFYCEYHTSMTMHEVVIFKCAEVNMFSSGVHEIVAQGDTYTSISFENGLIHRYNNRLNLTIFPRHRLGSRSSTFFEMSNDEVLRHVVAENI